MLFNTYGFEFITLLTLHTQIEPFLRSGFNESNNSNITCQYVGVFKVNSDKNFFGIDFPLLKIEKCREDLFSLPPCCRTRGSRIILRADLDSEYVAGQLYAYVIRVLYGQEGVNHGLRSIGT